MKNTPNFRGSFSGKERSGLALQTIPDSLRDMLRPIIQIVMGGIGDDKNISPLRAGLVEQRETVVVGAEQAGLITTHNELQGLGLQLIDKMKGSACAEDVECVGRSGILATRYGVVIDGLDIERSKLRLGLWNI